MTYSSARAQMSSAGKEALAIVLNMLLFVLPFKANYPLASLSPLLELFISIEMDPKPFISKPIQPKPCFSWMTASE